jgi:hypothetical protein
MKHPAISKHRRGQWQYWGNVGDVGNHMLTMREMATDVKKNGGDVGGDTKGY